jgi:hypothetical protein
MVSVPPSDAGSRPAQSGQAGTGHLARRWPIATAAASAPIIVATRTSPGSARAGPRRAAPDFGVFRQAADCGDVGWIVRGGQLYGQLVVDEDSASADRVRAAWQLQSLGDVRWRGDGVDGEQLVAESARFGGDVGGGVDDERPPVADVNTLANAADQ